MLIMTKSQRESVRERKEIKDEAHQLQDKEQEEWDRMEGE
jgi:hypothetical protein